MTKVQDVFRRASELSEDRQDELAAAIEAEIEAEVKWAELLSKSREALGKQADEALDEERSGVTRALDSDLP